MARNCSRSITFTPASTHTEGSDSSTVMLRGRRVVMAMLAECGLLLLLLFVLVRGSAADGFSSFLPTALGVVASAAAGAVAWSVVDAQKKGWFQE